MRKFDVVGICNALVDVLIQVDEADVHKLGMDKGIMHLVDGDRQRDILTHFEEFTRTIEIGGSAMNAIRTLAALGKKTAFAGMIADDDFGHLIRHRMDELGIAGRLGTSKEEPTGSCVILVTPDGERTMNTNLGASRLYGETEVPREEIAAGRILHFCGYQWDTDGQKQAVRSAVTAAEKADTLISFDLADPFVVKRFAKDFEDMIENHADIVFANREEARLLWNDSPDAVARRIAKAGAVAVVKLGAEGALVAKGDELHHVAPVPTHVVDTTAAGDMFAAGFLYGFVEDRPLPICGRLGALLASDVISRMGGVVSMEALREARDLAAK